MTKAFQADGTIGRSAGPGLPLGAEAPWQDPAPGAFATEATLVADWWRSVDERPGSIALRCGPVAVTSDALRRRASAVARRARTMAGPEPDIAVVVRRGHQLVAAVVAAACAGGRSSVLSPSMWRRDLAAATAGKLVITERALAAQFAMTPTICIDDLDPGEPSEDDRLDEVRPLPASRFVIVSTGETVTQGSLAALARSLRHHSFPAERVALVADATSKDFLAELWSGLALGAVVHLMPAVTEPAEALVKALRAETDAYGRMSFVVTPGAARSLLSAIPDLSTVARGVTLCGTGLDPVHSGAVAAHARENTTLLALTASGHEPVVILPIDAAEADPLVARDDASRNADLVVADAERDDVPPGTIGEVWLRTASGGLAKTGAQGWKTPSGSREIFVSAEWEIAHLHEPQRSRLVGDWRERLAGAPLCIELPTDRPRPPTLSKDYANIAEELPSALVDAVNALATRLQSTVSAVCLAAFATVLQRYNRDMDIVIGATLPRREGIAPASNGGTFANVLPVRLSISGPLSFGSLVERLTVDLAGARDRMIPFRDLVEAAQIAVEGAHGPLCQAFFAYQPDEPAPDDDLATCGGLRPLGRTGAARGDLALAVTGSGGALTLRLTYAPTLFEETTARRIAAHLVRALGEGVSRPNADPSRLDILPPDERRLLVAEWAEGKGQATLPRPVQDQIAAQVERIPSAPAVVDDERTLTYRELDDAAEALAAHLQSLGAHGGTVVGVYMGRSVQTVVALLGILKAGAAYLPLDPGYPADRLALMIADSGAAMVVSTTDLMDSAAALGAAVVPVDAVKPTGSRTKPAETDWPARLAYLIYTSGSTGQPKGVRITHGNLATFLAAMDAKFGSDEPGTWLAVTSISFDISVLELLWTLTRGFRVVVQAGRKPQAAPSSAMPPRPVAASDRPLELSLFFFGNATADQEETAARYRLVFDAAHFADENGFTALWTPERHFHAFGGLYPNPAVLAAALAAKTRRIGIRAGSVVLPLHDPLRVAEEWALVDNLSGGRVGVSFASGWQPDDFVLAPDRYEKRKQHMCDGIEEVRRLWTGERIVRRNGVGKEIEVSIYPRPVQAELPVWITSSRHRDTFIMAGEAGAGILTHLIGHTIEELAEKIALYREAWHRSGRPSRGHVTLMLHTFVGQAADRVKDLVRRPLKDYIRTSYDLMAGLGVARGVDMRDLPEQEIEGLLERGFERFFAHFGLLGTVADVAATMTKLSEIGVDEAGCLIDFGVDDDHVLAALPHLASARELYLRNRSADEATRKGERTALDDMRRHAVTHIQCTPTLAGLLLAERGASEPLRQLRRFLVGGEALPPGLAAALAEAVGGTVHNMYGPTEVTVWATSCDVSPGQTPTIGRPLPGYRAYVVDASLQPVPIGVAGELLLGGDAVADGYYARPELTEKRFIPDHLSGASGGLLYHTGDLVRWNTSGALEFLGRIDHQIKLRGRRIELGEIEAALCRHGSVKRAVCDVRGEGDARRIVAYGEIEGGHRPPGAEDLQTLLGSTLPDYMVPSDFVWLEALPLTPNGKVDRKALPDPPVRQGVDGRNSVPLGGLEEQIASIWRQVLKIEAIGRNDNFFHIGGNSILIVATRSMLLDRVGDVSIVDLFRYPTVATLAAALAVKGAPGSVASCAASRAAQAANRRLAARRSRAPTHTSGV